MEWGEQTMQTTRPRDLGALVLVLGVFVVLLVVSILIGSPTVH
jgi:Na+-transporting methylmalonyl-CoA/oxaloacetate decarboxylase gamma subunit